jgi:hypothetical protein
VHVSEGGVCLCVCVRVRARVFGRGKHTCVQYIYIIQNINLDRIDSITYTLLPPQFSRDVKDVMLV